MKMIKATYEPGPLPKHTGEPFAYEDDLTIREMVRQKRSPQEIAARLRRTVRGVMARTQRLLANGDAPMIADNN